ncbi:MAG TPA: type IV toxin-antitoxin system AbiEi family antitoxin domain-containing protein, partial [Micrococcaceae bacterium]
MDEIRTVFAKYGGVARAKVLEAEKVSAARLRLAVADGSIEKIARGVYALQGAPADLKRIRSLPAEPVCVTAAAMLGLWVLKAPARAHIGITHGRCYEEFVCHRFSGRPDVADVVVQCLRCLPPIEALVVAESAVVKKRTSVAEIRRRLTHRNDASARALVGRIVPQSQSILECVARFHLVAAGYIVDSQVKVAGLGHLDLMVDGVLGVETDGAGFHSAGPEFEEDRRRWNV